MAVGILSDVNEVGGFAVVHMDKLREKNPERFTETGAMDHKWFEETIRPVNFIYVREDKNSIAFTIQNGPVKEVGVNGCQVDTMISMAKVMIEKFNEGPFKNLYNTAAIASLDIALRHLADRKAERETRQVEGTSNV